MLWAGTPTLFLAGILVVVTVMKCCKGTEITNATLTWPVLMLLLVTWMCAMAIRSMYVDVLLPTKYLTPEGLLLNAQNRLKSTGDLHFLESWQEEIGYPWGAVIRYSTLCSSCWVVIGWAMTVFNVGNHIWRISEIIVDYHTTHKQAVKNLLFKSFLQHDATIRILFLPMIYGLMSFHGVLRCTGIAAIAPAGLFVGWEEVKAFHDDMYETSFMVADLYEAYALVIFGRVAMKVVRMELLKGDLSEEDLMLPTKEEEAKANQGGWMGWLLNPMGLKEDSDKSGSDSDDEHVEEAHGGDHGHDDHSHGSVNVSVADLLTYLRGLADLGIRSFFMTATTQSVYNLTVSTCAVHGLYPKMFRIDPDHPGSMQKPKTKAEAHYFLLGAGFVASCAAIGNLVIIEQSFHHALAPFRPFLKFLATKVLVSLAFFQQIGMVILLATSPLLVQNLVYALGLTFECVFVGLLHSISWGTDEAWYRCGLPVDAVKVAEVPDRADTE